MQGPKRDGTVGSSRLCPDGGLAVERGVCRDLVADDFRAAWVGVVSGDHVVELAAAGTVSPSGRTVSLSTTGAVADAVTTGDVSRSETVPEGVDDTVTATLAAPFWEPEPDAEESTQPDGVVVGYAADPTPADERALATAARGLGRHRALADDDPDGFDGRFQTAFARHDAAMLLIDPETGEIVDANDAAVAFYGYDATDLIGTPIQAINVASDEEVADERSRARRQERNYFLFEHELASGERRTVEVHSTPVPLSDGPVLFSVIHDVTDQVEYERELERYGDLFENVPVGLFRSRPGPQGCFEEVNPAMVSMFGADSRAELLGHSPADLYVDPDERAAFSEELLESGAVEEYEVELRRLDGESFWGSVSAIRTEMDDGPVFDGLIQDVSERVAYEQSLERRTERMEVLNQLLRHDIRNDMAVIGGNLDLVEPHVDEAGQTHLDTLRERADHVVELTHTARNITETMSVESGGDLETVPVRLDRLLVDALSNARSSFPHATLELDAEPPAVSVWATEMLESVFRNLLNNAVQHNDTDEPHVEVSVTVGDETAVVRVADDGPGIPDRQKETVFERGQKGSTSSGTGLGLYLVGVLVDSYDGEITVTDNDPRGAVFEVRLSRADEDTATDVFGGVAE